MRLGVNLGYRLTADVQALAETTRTAESLGYSVAWVAEAYGSDSTSVLGYLAGQTSRIGLGAGVMQIPARSPAMTAMTAASLDLLSAGRFRLGLGVSGPQVSEGWHGVRFEAPLQRTREYVDVVRQVLTGQPVTHEGQHFPLPLPGSAGKALRLALHPPRRDLPIYLAAVGPRNVELAGEIADGWLAILVTPEHVAVGLDRVKTGQSRAAAGSGRAFDVAASIPVSVGTDLQACADVVRPYIALYVGGMGSREHNFYNEQATRLGFEAAAQEIQQHYLAGRIRDAAAAVPFELVDATALVGPLERIAEGMQRYAAAGVTTLNVLPFASQGSDFAAVLAAAADACARADLAEP